MPPGSLIDQQDRRLIALLQENARLSYQEMAKRLGVSAQTVKRRVDFLLRSGTLKLVAVPSWSKLGLHLAAFIAVSVELDRLQAVATALSQMEEIVFVAFAAGDYDIIAQVVLHENEDLVRFATYRVAPIEGIRDLRTFMIPSFVKSFEEYRIPEKLNPLYLRREDGSYALTEEELLVMSETALRNARGARADEGWHRPEEGDRT